MKLCDFYQKSSFSHQEGDRRVPGGCKESHSGAEMEWVGRWACCKGNDQKDRLIWFPSVRSAAFAMKAGTFHLSILRAQRTIILLAY